MKLRPCTSKARPRGVSLLFALVTLVALSLAAVALVRSVNNSSLIIGNLGFKQDTIAFASRASEAAVDFLNGNISSGKLDKDDGDLGYYATANENLDPTNRRKTDATRAVVDWAGDDCKSGYAPGSFASCIKTVELADGARGNATRYAITRLCQQPLPADDPGNFCARPISATLTEGGDRGAIGYPGPRDVTLTEGGPYFRILVRSAGARNTVSYTETIVHF